MSDTDKESDHKPPSPSEKKRLARAEVRNALRDQRAKLRELRQEMRAGQDLSDDIDSCSGEIELLMKELQSIEEGGHTTFLDAKNLIAPKKDISSKKKNIKDQLNEVQKNISELEQRLYFPNLGQEERDRIIQEIAKNNKHKQDLEEELVALKQYNHTRFVAAREENRKLIELEEKLDGIESELSELEVKMVDAVEMQNHSLISELKEKMESLEEEKKKLVLPEKDPFLEEEEELSDPFVEESEEL
jgi:chromosome segregation ATPase